MKKLTHSWAVPAVAAMLAFSSMAAVAQSRSSIVTRPALMAFTKVKATTEAPVRGGPITTSAVIVVTPTPLPPRPPNFCSRGNSAGVSRC